MPHWPEISDYLSLNSTTNGSVEKHSARETQNNRSSPFSYELNPLGKVYPRRIVGEKVGHEDQDHSVVSEIAKIVVVVVVGVFYCR